MKLFYFKRISENSFYKTLLNEKKREESIEAMKSNFLDAEFTTRPFEALDGDILRFWWILKKLYIK